MMKRFLLLVVMASHTRNIMPMFNVIPRFNVFVCCFSLGCTIPEENECINLNLCCAGCAIGCPDLMPPASNNNQTIPKACKNKNGHTSGSKDPGHADLGNNFDFSDIFSSSSSSSSPSYFSDSDSDISVPEKTRNMHSGSTDIVSVGGTVVSLQPGMPGTISRPSNNATGAMQKSLNQKATQNMVVHSYSVAKFKSSSYNYSYHSESIETANSYSKRTVEQVSTPYENTERRSAVVFVNEPDQQI